MRSSFGTNVKEKLMEKFITGLIGLLSIITIMLWMVVMLLGSTEILWWIFTGEFFHFVSLAPVPVSTF